MEALLSLRDISVGYGETPVVTGASFDIAAGEFCALLGLNGSGKTTLLKGLCGLLPVIGGRCFSRGLDCTDFNEKERARTFSYIPQRFSKLISVTVMDAVIMGLNAKLGMLELPSAADKASAMEALEKMEIPHLAGEDFSRLSEGQKQLVILARALVQNAPIMLMDEPDSSLDFPNKHRTLARIRRLISDESKAGLVTLHDPNLALAHCDRLVMLHDGKVASDIRLAGAGADEVRSCLSTIYGEVSLYEHGGKYCVQLYSMSMAFSNCNDGFLSSGAAEEDGGLTPS